MAIVNLQHQQQPQRRRRKRRSPDNNLLTMWTTNPYVQSKIMGGSNNNDSAMIVMIVVAIVATLFLLVCLQLLTLARLMSTSTITTTTAASSIDIISTTNVIVDNVSNDAAPTTTTTTTTTMERRQSNGRISGSTTSLLRVSSSGRNNNNDPEDRERYYNSMSSNFIPGVLRQENQPNVRRKWAYVFLMGGCNPLQPQTYRGTLYNILISAHLLRQKQPQDRSNYSTAHVDDDANPVPDIVVMVQMSKDTIFTELDDYDVRLLHEMNVIILYLPKPPPQSHYNFYSLQMEKFRILDMIQYSRVMYLDGDLMPFCNLQYIFELSEPLLQEEEGKHPILKENIIHTMFDNEPCNGGWFVLAPGKGKYEQIQHILKKRHEDAKRMGSPYFNTTIGWGHVISRERSDSWKSLTGGTTTGNEWNWYAAIADQGLLYYWVKYYQQSTSIIIGNDIENWVPSSASTSASKAGSVGPILEETLHHALDSYTCLPKVSSDS